MSADILSFQSAKDRALHEEVKDRLLRSGIFDVEASGPPHQADMSGAERARNFLRRGRTNRRAGTGIRGTGVGEIIDARRARKDAQGDEAVTVAIAMAESAIEHLKEAGAMPRCISRGCQLTEAMNRLIDANRRILDALNALT